MSVLIAPGSDEWARIISPSKVAAIVGVSRWESPYSLWHRMRGQVPGEEPKDEFTVGHAFEPALAYLWRDENPGWQLSPGEVQTSTDTIGFPAIATLDRRARRGRARRVVEFKTARDLSEWGDEFTDAAPIDYVVQITMQMLITGYTDRPAHLKVMGPFFKHHTYEIPFDTELAESLVRRCAAFWASLTSDEAPDLDDTVPTYQAVRALHPDIDGSTAPVDAKIAAEFLTTQRDLAELETAARGAKTNLLAAMGQAQYATVNGVRVADRRKNSHGSVSLYPAKKADPSTFNYEAAS